MNLMNLDLSYIASIILGSIGIILLVTTYLYIEKLERIGCPCSEHPYRNFIKGYCIFAIVYIFVTMFIPPKLIVQVLGPSGVMIYFVAKVLFTLTTLIFFILAFIYARFLMNEKCKCSEDIRREVMYIWAITEIVILGAAIVIPYMIYNAGIAIALISSTVKELGKNADAIEDITINPLKNLANVPRNLQSSAKAVGKLLRGKR